MSAALRPLLPLEPGVADPSRQAVLTARHLQPALPAMEALLLGVRAAVDGDLHGLRASSGKAYPLGCCLEITRAVEQRLAALDPSALPPAAAEGAAALAAFRAAGGEVRRAWGVLREQYFQNAFVMGTLYVDAANDTVVPSKPKVEILPFAEAAFRPIADFRHYARITAAYWSAQVFPNHLLPGIAPFFPLLVVFPDGRLTLKCDTAYMACLTLRGAFAPSADVLADPPLPVGLFEALRPLLADAFPGLPPTAEEGRRQALAACAAYRAAGWHGSGERVNEAVAALEAAKARLTQLRVSQDGSQP